MKKFKITLETSFDSLTVTIILFVVFSISSIFILFIEKNKIFLYALWIVYIIMNFPVLLIHINYWFTDRNKVVQFDPDNQKILLSVGKKNSSYSFSDIRNIILTENSFFDKSGPLKVINRRLPWSEYFYYQINLNDNKKILITSLSIKRTEFPLKVNQHRYDVFPATN